MSMQRKEPTEAIAALRSDAITITTEQCIKAWREAVPGALDDPSHIDVVGAMGSASSIGLGIALAQPGKKVIVIEPTQPETIYVPYYNPATAYGAWP